MGPGTLAVLVSALFGSAIAAFADLAQKGNAGAIAQIQSTFATALNWPMPAWLPILALVILGVGLCFVFQPQTRQAGFAVGLSVISVVMTATPVKLPAGPAATPISPNAALEQPYLRLASLEGAAALRPVPIGEAWAQQSPPAPGIVRLNFSIAGVGTPPPPLGEATIRVRELPSGKIWQWHTDQYKQSTAFPLQFFYDVPIATTTNSVEAHLESENYKSETKQVAVTPGSPQVQLNFALEPSPYPKVIKRLIEPRAY